MNKQFTPHFNLSEFTYSPTAYAHKIINTPDLRICNNIYFGCVNILEPLAEFMKVPIVITSGYRCTALNNLVGGVKNSQHTTGEAADIRIIDKFYAQKMFDFLKTNKYVDQLLFEHKGNTQWIHVSWSINRAPRHYINFNYHA